MPAGQIFTQQTLNHPLSDKIYDDRYASNNWAIKEPTFNGSERFSQMFFNSESYNNQHTIHDPTGSKKNGQNLQVYRNYNH